MTYLLDANVFMQAKNLHYGLDFCPAFWDWLIVSNAAGRVFSIEKVGDEIDAGADELAAWASPLGAGFFLKPDARVLPALGSVSSWVMEESYEPPPRARSSKWPTTISWPTYWPMGTRW